MSLVDAELAWSAGNYTEAQLHFEAAISHARHQGFVHLEALALEHASLYYASRNLYSVANGCLRDAVDAYGNWGATHKADELKRNLNRWNVPTIGGVRRDFSPTSVDEFNLSTIVSLTKALSEEMELDKLIERLMTTALQQAGAQRALLVAPVSGELQIDAEAIASKQHILVRRRQDPELDCAAPQSILRYVMRTKESVIIDDALSDVTFADEIYFASKQTRSLLCLPLVKQQSLIGILYLENNAAAAVFSSAQVNFLGLLASQAAISLQNARLYSDLRHMQAYLSEAQRLSLTGSFGWTPETGNLAWSDETYRILDYPPSLTPVLAHLMARVHPEDRAHVSQQLDRAAEGYASLDFEHRLLMPDQTVKFVRIFASATHDGERSPREYVGAVMDVTSARISENLLHASLMEKDALLKEIHHRVKNNLQLVTSLLSLHAGQISDPAISDKLLDCRNRVRTMALVHDNLYHTGDFARIPMAQHLRTLCSSLARTFGLDRERIAIDVEADSIDLDLGRAVSCGLIVNELVSNALKHAFPGDRKGSISLAFHRSAIGACVLSVSDNGIGMSQAEGAQRVRRNDSLGLQLVEDLVRQLNGTMTQYHGSGTSYAIEFPTPES
ncbi:hypothetical protein WT13_32010 [Burkholderia anthina]|nr:hypothetical protein WT13_32010 [Burkholderia anthina]